MSDTPAKLDYDKYLAMLPDNAGPPPGVVWFDEEIEMTPELLETLRKFSHPTPPPAPSRPSAP